MEDKNVVVASPKPDFFFGPQVSQTRKKSWGKIILWIILVLVLMLAVVQYMNAAKYEALVQVISENKIGVNPTDKRLDFGDLPRDKSATRTVTLKSGGKTDSFVVVWTLGGINDLMKVNKNNFTLKAGTTEKLEFSVYVPNSAENKYYRGRVVIFQIPKFW
jgi:K+-transporting ATPase A subunit